MRIADDDGHLWPHTGHRCSVCKMPADLALDGQSHPECQPAETLDDDVFAALVRRVTTEVGRRASAPSATSRFPSTPAPGVLVHIECWQNRAATPPRPDPLPTGERNDRQDDHEARHR